jgi:hypothetical protein
VEFLKGEHMKRRTLAVLAVAAFLSMTATHKMAQSQTSQQTESPARRWGSAFTRYSDQREGYESLPVRVAGVRGGKLGPEEKTKIEVSALENRSTKPITAAKFSWYLFNMNDLDKVVQTGQTALTNVDLMPKERRRFDIFILYLEDIPLLRDENPMENFILEVAVTEVHYQDGSMWEATGLETP